MRNMKIIDFARKGNLVRFFLGADDCLDYTGDDWNDAPYDCNAENVYEEYVTGYRDIGFQFDSLVLEPCDGFLNTPYSKDDMKYNGVTINSGKGTLTKGEKVLELTKNEMIIFTYLFSKKGTIVSRNDLMTDLWNNNEYINDNALTVNISRLRAKLEEFGLNNVIETRKGQGYKLI